jgi:hypothetical protein
MEAEGLPDLGNAAGSVFRGKEWRFTGRYIKSSRVSRHANENKLMMDRHIETAAKKIAHEKELMKLCTAMKNELKHYKSFAQMAVQQQGYIQFSQVNDPGNFSPTGTTR